MMVPLGEVIGAFNLIALGCASVEVADVRLTVESLPGADGELDSAVAISVVTGDQTSATTLASLLGLEATLAGTWSGLVTPANAALPARCTVTPWRTMRTATPAEAGTGLRTENRAAS